MKIPFSVRVNSLTKQHDVYQSRYLANIKKFVTNSLDIFFKKIVEHRQF